MVGRSIAPRLRTSSVLCSFISSQVRWTMRCTPDLPTNMWWASSISMKRQERASGSKPDLGERGELELAVAVGEVGEHEEGEPVRRLLVEGAQDARLVGIAGMALQQHLGLLAAVAAEIGVQQVDHGPQVPAFLAVDLEEVAQVVERGRGLAQQRAAARPRRARCRPGSRSGGAGSSAARPAPPATPACPCCRRRRSRGWGPGRRGRCPSDSPASSRSRSWPSRWPSAEMAVRR